MRPSPWRSCGPCRVVTTLVVTVVVACSSSDEAGSKVTDGGGNGGTVSTGGSDSSGAGSGGAPSAGGRSGGSVDAGSGNGGTPSSCTCGYAPSPSTGWKDRCPAFPSFPDEHCTGTTSSPLPLYTGSLEFRTDGQIVENVEMRIESGLYVPADNVTFRNVKLVFTGPLDSDFSMVNLNYNSGTVFEDCELDGQGNVARAITGVASR